MAAVTHYLFTVISRRMITPTVLELTFDSKPIPSADPKKPSPTEPFHFEAGQYISVIVPGAGPGGRDLRRAYSVASEPERNPVEFCIKIVDSGPGSNYLNGLKPGESFHGYGPYGDFVYVTPAIRGVCFIATGTGIAPFRSMMLSKQLQENPPKDVLCLLGVREEEELLYEEELSNRTYHLKDGNAVQSKWVACVSKPTDQWKGFRGRVTDYLRSLGDSYPWIETEYYLCGSGQMIDEVREILTEKGVENSSIHREVYFKPAKPLV